MPVAISALIWSAIALFVIVAPPSASGASIVIVVGLFLVGGLYFLNLLKFDRDVLETEPGDTEMFKH